MIITTEDLVSLHANKNDYCNQKFGFTPKMMLGLGSGFSLVSVYSTILNTFSAWVALLQPNIPPGGELSVALTRHREACSSKPGVGGIFFLLWPFSVSHYLSLGFSSKVSSLPVHSLG